MTGGLIGAALGGSWPLWAAAGALLLAAGELLTDLRRVPSAAKPFAYRVAVAVLFAAAYGGLLVLLWPTVTLLQAALLTGLPLGLFSFRWRNLLLATAVALFLAFLAAQFRPGLSPVWLSALIMLAYRLLAAWLLPRPEPLRIAAEQVPAADVPYVVPYMADSAYIGTDYFAQLAQKQHGRFARNPAEIGLVSSLDLLQGPDFDPALVDPLIRDFYEHTSAYTLEIVPVWVARMKPVFWLYKRFVARRIGQANLPFNQEEAQRGVVSSIDTIDFSGEGIVDLRGWVRSFEATGEAIYVGIYTTFRHQETGFVSVGFPLPEASFTATLVPSNWNGSDFLLSTRDTGHPFAGHTISFRDDDDQLTVLALPTFGEEIEVKVRDGALTTDHRFYLGDLLFLTLYYTIIR